MIRHSQARRLSLVLAVTFPMGAGAQETSPTVAVNSRTLPVVRRSRETTATYSLYSWNWVRNDDGSQRQGWSAEFHRGRLHRVETPDVRLVADCAVGTGSGLDVRTGRTFSGQQVAAAACGVNANATVSAADWVARRETDVGPVDLVRLLDETDERSYAIDDDGVLVAAEIFPRDTNQSYCVQNEALAVKRRLPEEDIFSADSLSRSVVPERYRAAPHGPAADLWLRPFSCF